MKATEREEKESRSGYGLGLPIISFKDSIKSIEDLCATGGQDGTFDALSNVLNNTLTSSSFKKKLAVLKNYGLIIPDGANEVYSITALGMAIAHPTSLEDQVASVKIAMLNLPVLRKIWESRKGKILPPQVDYFANFLGQNLSIPNDTKMEWARYFIDAARFANILEDRSNGIYVASSIATAPKAENYFEDHDQQTPATESEPKVAQPIRFEAQPPTVSKAISEYADLYAETIKIRISGDRAMQILIPDGPMTANDISRIRTKMESVIAGLPSYLEGD